MKLLETLGEVGFYLREALSSTKYSVDNHNVTAYIL
jgi:hypothetical protein